ncbi:MAG: C40 family peptidase [Brevirhabdus sp.]
MSDPRQTPANANVAHITLKGRVSAQRFVEGSWHRVTTPLCDLTRRPGGARDRQLLFGERILVLETVEGIAFGETERDGYVGYVDATHLGADVQPTHWVSARSTHRYSAPDFKSSEVSVLSFGSWLCVTGEQDNFARLDTGQHVPLQHVRALDDWLDDPATVAEGFLGTPYLWGGNSGAGIDCSGLVQAALLACGTACPRDSDQQQAALGTVLPGDVAPARGDLVFWKGHVGMMLDETMLIHANAHHMATVVEPLAQAEARIKANEFGPITARKRLG